MAENNFTRDLQRLRRSRQTLETRVQERTAALAASNEALQREVAARQRAGEEVRLLLKLTQGIGEAKDLQSALDLTIQTICQFADWDYGEAWIPNPAGSALVLTADWHKPIQELAKFQEVCRGVSYPTGVGLPGRVWDAQQPEWVPDISQKSGTTRRPLLLEVGVKSAVGFPVIAGEVLAVLVFFMLEKREENQRQMEIVATVAGQLGSAIHRKHIEDELRKNDALLQAIMDNSTRVIYVKDPHGRYITVNCEYESRYHVRREQIRGKTDYDIFPKEKADAFRANDLKVVEAKAPMEFEEVAPHDDGLHTFISNKFPMFDSSGALYAVCGISTDITEQKRHERTLRQAREELEIGVRERTKDLEAEVIERQRIEEEIKARVRQQAIVAQIGQRALSGAELSALMEETCALVAQTLDVEFSKVLELLPDGQALRLRAGVGWNEGLIGKATVTAGLHSQAGYTLLSGAPVVVEDLRTETRFSGPRILYEHGIVSGMSVIIAGRDRPFGVLGAHTIQRRSFSKDDIYFLEAVANVLSEAIQRKSAEEEIQRGTDWLKSLIDTTQDAVVSIDRQGRIVLFNPAAEKIFGYARAEVSGKKVNMLMAEPYASEHNNYIERYERTGEPRAIGRIRTVTAKRKNGELFPIELSVTKVAEGQDVIYAAFIRDISEKSRLQAQLVETERLAAIGITAAKIGHELGNPLNGMSLTVQLLEQRLSRQSSAPDSQVDATVKRLKDEISRLNQLAGQFRTIARKDRYDFRPTQLATLIEDVIKLQTLHLEQLGIQVVNFIPADLPVMNLDRDKIKQAFLNLIKNATEAMPQGGKITIEAKATDDAILLDIADTGTGIPLDVDAFEPFVTTKKEGTGIGLVIVRQILIAHRGKISYRSRPGEGTTFRIELPRN